MQAQVKKKKLIFRGAVHANTTCSGSPVIPRAILFIYLLAYYCLTFLNVSIAYCFLNSCNQTIKKMILIKKRKKLKSVFQCNLAGPILN